MSIDTLSLARELRAVEFAGPQAEAIAAAIGRAVVETAVTKADLKQTEADLRGEILKLDGKIDRATAELRGEIEKVRSSMLMWFVGTQVAVGALVVALVKLIP